MQNFDRLGIPEAPSNLAALCTPGDPQYSYQNCFTECMKAEPCKACEANPSPDCAPCLGYGVCSHLEGSGSESGSGSETKDACSQCAEMCMASGAAAGAARTECGCIADKDPATGCYDTCSALHTAAEIDRYVASGCVKSESGSEWPSDGTRPCRRLEAGRASACGAGTEYDAASMKCVANYARRDSAEHFS